MKPLKALMNGYKEVTILTFLPPSERGELVTIVYATKEGLIREIGFLDDAFSLVAD